MIIVREVFIAKPGMASKLAKMIKDVWGEDRVMTDLSGPYNKVVAESEYKNMGEFEKKMESYMNDKEKKIFPSHIDMYTEGKREFYRLW